MRFVFRPRYLAACCLVLLVEIVIACTMHDRLIRPYGGDSLAVVLVYAGLRSFAAPSAERAVVAALFVAFGVEIAQAVSLVSRLGLEHHTFARTVIGTSFDWGDLVAYCIGAVAVWLFERKRAARPSSATSSSFCARRPKPTRLG